MEGRQYSAKELMVLISCGSQTYSTVNIPEREITIGASFVYLNGTFNPKIYSQTSLRWILNLSAFEEC